MNPAILLYLFLGLTVVDLIGILLGNHSLVILVKPLLMPALGLYAYAYTSKQPNKAIKLILYSLIFSWLGDIFLMPEAYPFVSNLIGVKEIELKEIAFLMGVAAFLIAHLFYIAAFIDNVKGKGKSSLLTKPFAALPVIIAYVLLLMVLIPTPILSKEPILKWAVIVYATVITSMVLSTLNRFKKVKQTSFVMVFFGAVIFMASDSMIAINAFHSPINNASFYIMFTYLLGQFLIVQGSLKNT